MIGYNRRKFEIISAALNRSPNLSNRAIARTTGTSPHTVGKVRAILGLSTANRFEASGRRARGREPYFHYLEERPQTTLYRAYHEQELLYIGASFSFMQRLAMHSRKPWWREVTHVTTTHFAENENTESAERLAIRNEQPRYNVAGRSGRRAGERRRAPAAVTRKIPAPLSATPTPGLIRRPTGRVLV